MFNFVVFVVFMFVAAYSLFVKVSLLCDVTEVRCSQSNQYFNLQLFTIIPSSQHLTLSLLFLKLYSS